MHIVFVGVVDLSLLLLRVRVLACYRGAAIGVEHAEAFMLVRELV